MIYTVEKCQREQTPTGEVLKVWLSADRSVVDYMVISVSLEVANKFHVGAKYNMTLSLFDGGPSK